MGITRSALFIVVLAVASQACGSDSEPAKESPTYDPRPPAPFDPNNPYDPVVDAADLSPEITNPWLPMPVGATWVSESVTEDGTERIEVSVEAATRTTFGTEARVIRDTAYLDDVLIEDTEDWFAQDSGGNVWYLGEETTAYEEGMPPSTVGSWEAGVDDALPGVVMLANPDVGHSYRQEFYEGEAEDYAIVRSLDEDVSVPAGDYTGCIKIEERSVLEADMQEFKYYCSGIGNVLVEEEDVREELVESGGL